MSKKLFVGGLSWGTADAGLREAFEKYGTVLDAKVISDRETGRSRGFGFVTFEDDAAADRAVAEMNGREIDGRTVRVNEAQDKPRPNGAGGGGGGGFGRREGSGGGPRGGGRGGRGGFGGGGDRW
jgi:cold-inducible RNA-binding protein